MQNEALNRQMKRTYQAQRELEKIRDELESIGITDLEEESNPFGDLILTKQEVFDARRTLQNLKTYKHEDYIRNLISERYITSAHAALLIASVDEIHQKDAFFIFLPYIVDPDNALTEVNRVLQYGIDRRSCATEYQTLKRAGMLCQIHPEKTVKEKISGVGLYKLAAISWAVWAAAVMVISIVAFGIAILAF